MAALPENHGVFSHDPDRRTFLWSLASFGLTLKTAKKDKDNPSPEPIYRFLTPDCEVRMSVEYYGKSLSRGFRFRDDSAQRTFCLDAKGQEGKSCLQRFVGSMAIARYHFYSRGNSQTPFQLRERVRTIDNDYRIEPRPPFERVLAAEKEIVSDIQAFGYNPDDSQQTLTSGSSIWSLLRQDLFLNGEVAAFLIVHWKHTLDSIRLVDVIPGDGTEAISG
jgi:hypothetical protein